MVNNVFPIANRPSASNSDAVTKGSESHSVQLVKKGLHNLSKYLTEVKSKFSIDSQVCSTFQVYLHHAKCYLKHPSRSVLV